MIVVSNTSPIINLFAVGQVELLHQLYGKVLIPQAVYHEVVVSGAGQAGAEEIQKLDWIEVRTVVDRALVSVLEGELDAGEAEAIALAVEQQSDLLLLDERQGRQVASRLGLKYIGLLGVLISAKQQGHIIKVKPIVDELIMRAGFWVNPQLYARVLEASGE